MSQGQVRMTFDSTTIGKIFRGMLYAVIFPAIIGILQYLDAADFGNTTVTIIIGWIVPVLVNIIKEWIKGNEPVELPKQ